MERRMTKISLRPEDLKREVSFRFRPQAEEDIQFKKDFPDWYEERLEDRIILSIKEQKRIVQSEETLFESFCRDGDYQQVPIYYDLVTPFLIDLEVRIINVLYSLPTEEELALACRMKEGKLVKLEKNEKEDLVLEGLEIMTCKKMGTHIGAIEVFGYNGVLHYDHRDILRGAPEEANAYWVGKARLVIVWTNKEGVKHCFSPLCCNTKLSPLNLEGEEYHLVPIQYFKIETENPVVRLTKELQKIKEEYQQKRKELKSYYSSMQKVFGLK